MASIVTTWLDKRRKTEADIEWAEYVHPLGTRGLHVVKIVCNAQVFVVGSSLSRKTFKPGTQVPLGSNTGHPGKFIIGSPPPGRRGASSFQIDYFGAGEFDTVGITSATPSTIYNDGIAVAVVFAGYGFNQTPVDVLSAVVYNESTKAWEADSLVTCGTVTWSSATSITAAVTVSTTAPGDKLISFKVVRG